MDRNPDRDPRKWMYSRDSGSMLLVISYYFTKRWYSCPPKTFICVLYLHLCLVGRYPPTLFCHWWKKTFKYVLYSHLCLVGRYPPTLSFRWWKKAFKCVLYLHLCLVGRYPPTFSNFFLVEEDIYIRPILHLCLVGRYPPTLFCRWWKKTFKYILYLYLCLVGRHPPIFQFFFGGRRHLNTSHTDICV